MLEIRKMLVGTVELGSLFVGRQAQQVPQNPIAKTGDIPGLRQIVWSSK